MLSMKTKNIVLALVIVSVLMLSLAPTAGAEIVGRTYDGYIHRWTAGNGQDLYFVSNTEEPLVETDKDVNFDGHPDLAVVTVLGASNAYYDFYLWNGGEYEYAERSAGDIVNFELVDGRYLVSRRNDGSAGALFHTEICVWDGSVLKSIRTMVSEEETSIDWKGRIQTLTTNLDRLHVTLWQTDGLAGEAAVLWEKTYDPFSENPDAFDEMESHLWDGLRN